MAGPTYGEYEKELRRILVERVKEIRLMRHPMWSGRIIYEGDVVRRFRIDPFWMGIGTTVIHELIHYQRREVEGSKGSLDEAEVLGVERAMWKFILKKQRWRWWRREIYRRLRGQLWEAS